MLYFYCMEILQQGDGYVGNSQQIKISGIIEINERVKNAMERKKIVIDAVKKDAAERCRSRGIVQELLEKNAVLLALNRV